MRLLAAIVVAPAALCGCNQIYGLDSTRARDAAPDAPYRQVRLSLLVGPTSDVATEAPPILTKVAPDPRPRVGLLDKPLAEVAYVEDATSGVVDYPPELVGQRWRLEYTPPAGAPYEVQWSPPDGAGHLVVPFIGRFAQTPMPPDTGFTMTMKLANNVLYNFSDQTVIYTSGYWSAAPSPAATLTPRVDFATAKPLSGALGAPSAAAKDVVVAIDYQTGGDGCATAKISGSAIAQDVEAGAMKPLELVRDMETEIVEVTYDGETIANAQSRLDQALGARSGDISGGRVVYGRLAHTLLPGFTTLSADVPAPVMIPLATCPTSVTMISTNPAGGGLSFTKAMYVFAANDRVVGGARLRSSIAAIGLKDAVMPPYEVTIGVPLATNVTLGTHDLDAGPDGSMVGSEPLDLAFAVQTGPAFVVDYYEVVLYRIAAGALEPVRVYVGADASPKLRIDPTVMTAGDEYVFAIRTYRGRPNARNADFRTVQGPQAVATVFTRTFRR